MLTRSLALISLALLLLAAIPACGGGAWYLNTYFVRSSLRLNFTPSSTRYYIGFRVARAPL